MTASAPFSITINAASSVPQWFTDLPYSQWQLVGSNSMGSVSSINNYGLTHTWTGAAVDDASRKFVIGAPGGHNDPGENAIFEFRLGDASPAWYRTRIPNGVSVSDTPNNFGTDSSGQPSHTHSYHRPVVARGRFWLPGLDSVNTTNGNWTTATFSYDLAQTSGGTWRQHGRLTTGSIPKWLGGSAAYDSVTDRIFSFPQAMNGGPGYYFDVSDVLDAADVPAPGAVVGATAINGPAFGSWVYNGSVVAQGLRRLVMSCTDSDTWGFLGIRSLQLDNLGAGWTSHTISGTQPFAIYGGGGFVYHESARRFYSYNSVGNEIRVLQVPATVTNAWTGYSVTLGGLTAASGVGTAYGNTSRGFSRFNIVQNMGNGEACLVWYPTFTLAGIYVCRLPSAGL